MTMLKKCEYKDCDYLMKVKGRRRFCPTHFDMHRINGVAERNKRINEALKELRKLSYEKNTI